MNAPLPDLTQHTLPIVEAGVRLIMEWEGFVPHAYHCPAGTLTIGWGRTESVYEGEGTSEEEEIEWFLPALQRYRDAVIVSLALGRLRPRSGAGRCRASMWPRYKENQLAAMTSLCYNIGPAAFRSSSVCKFHREGKYREAADAFRLWNKYTDPETGRKRVSKGLKKPAVKLSGICT